jgi:sugar O-acyltransferase (sialic acid O-acetyltransferase NeuD family)
MMPEKVVIFGLGAQTKVALEILTVSQQYQAEAIVVLGDYLPKEKQIYQVPIVSWDEDQIAEWLRQDLKNAIVLHKDNKTKAGFMDKLIKLGFNLVNVIHPWACIATTATVGHNVLINAFAVIQPFARIGNGVVIHSKVGIGHDNLIENYVNIAPGATLAGWVHVQECAYIYINAAIINGRKIGKEAVVGASSMVMKDVPDYAVVMGNPAKIIWNKRKAQMKKGSPK